MLNVLLGLVISLTAVPLFAAEAPVMQCTNIQLAADMDNTGKIVWQDWDGAVLIYKDPAGKYGFRAQVTHDSKTEIEMDTEIQLMDRKSLENSPLFEFAMSAYPDFDFEQVTGARVGNVGVDANSDDAAGINVVELQDKSGRVLKKLLTLGWGFGQCGGL